MEQLVTVGMVVVFVGIALIIIGALSGGGAGGGKGSEVKWGVGGFIGPLPFGFANDKWMLYLVIALSMVVFIISILMSQKLI